MSFYLMKSTKDDESDFGKQGQFHIDFSPFRATCTEQQNKLPRKARHSLFPGGLVSVRRLFSYHFTVKKE